MSPFDVGRAAFVVQVTSAETFLQWCRVTIDSFEQYMSQSSPEEQGRLREVLRELSDNVRQGERTQAMGEISLEVAASLLCFWSDRPSDVISVVR